MPFRITWRYLLAFILLSFLCGTAHELIHHVVGYAVCGEWGYKTFNYFHTACDSSWTLLATAAGPALSFALMWWGWHLLRRPDRPSQGLGLALIFANLPLNRLVFPALGYNDEHLIAYELLPHHAGARVLSEAVVLALGLPPLVATWRRLRPGWGRLGWFAGFLVLPLAVFIVVILLGLEPLVTEKKFLWQTVWGVPYLVLVVELGCTLGYYALRRALWVPVRDQGAPATAPVAVSNGRGLS